MLESGIVDNAARAGCYRNNVIEVCAYSSEIIYYGRDFAILKKQVTYVSRFAFISVTIVYCCELFFTIGLVFVLRVGPMD